MTDNIERVKKFIFDKHLDLNTVVLKFDIRVKDRGFDMSLSTVVFQNIHFLDENYIREFCNKHQCRCYMYVLQHNSLINIHNFNNILFKEIYLTYCNSSNLELYIERNMCKYDYRKIDLDDKSYLPQILEFLDKYNIKDIELFDDKTGSSIIFKSDIEFTVNYINNPLSYKNALYLSFNVNLYIPDFVR